MNSQQKAMNSLLEQDHSFMTAWKKLSDRYIKGEKSLVSKALLVADCFEEIAPEEISSATSQLTRMAYFDQQFGTSYAKIPEAHFHSS